MMGVGFANRPHFVELDRDSGSRKLPGCFGSGQAATDNMHFSDIAAHGPRDRSPAARGQWNKTKRRVSSLQSVIFFPAPDIIVSETLSRADIMVGRTIIAVFTYILGLVALVIWSIYGFVTGAPKDDWALMIVLPLAWAFSYWPMLGSLIMISRIRGLQRTLEGIGRELEAGNDPSPERMRELEDVGTHLAAHENRLPEFIVRPIIRRLLNRSRDDGSLKRVIEKGKEKSEG